MLFSSIEFVFLFLPAILAVYLSFYLVAGRSRWGPRILNCLLLFISLALYTWSESSYTLVILASIGIDYVCGLLLGKRSEDGRTAGDRVILAASITTNLGLLVFFKYINFGTDTVIKILEAFGIYSPVSEPVLQIALPLGISFYTFQSMSYTIDVYLGRVNPTKNWIDFACYVTMFPQLVAGPIVRYREISQFLTNRTIDTKLFASGVKRFVFGLGKKLLIADTLSGPADLVFASEGVPISVAWLGLVCFTLQIYFDFSGYSDMAIGLCRMLGFRIPENFRHPYSATSMRDFWRRWHISLSNWFRDYVYIPIGGNRLGRFRTYFNLSLVFFLCGLWHGASWTFVIWGLLHGCLLVLERIGLSKILARCWQPLRHAYVIIAVMICWVMFRCETIGDALEFGRSLVGLADNPMAQSNFLLIFEPDVILAMVVGAILSFPIAKKLDRKYLTLQRTLKRPFHRQLVASLWLVVSISVFGLVLFLSWMQLATTTHQPFLYFRF